MPGKFDWLIIVITERNREELFYAICSEQLDALVRLRQLFSSLSTCDVSRLLELKFGNCRESPLMFAAVRGSPNILKLILSYKPKLDDIDYIGRTALMYGVKSGSHEIVTQLINAGANVNIQDNYGRTALMYGAEVGYVKVAQSLLFAQNLLVDLTDNAGRNALIYAAMSGKREIVKNLIDFRAECDCQDNEGLNPSIFAAKHNDIELSDILIKAGVEINAQGYDGTTALIVAVGNGHADLVKYMLENGANQFQKTQDNVTALMLASHQYKKDVVLTMLRHNSEFSDLIKNAYYNSINAMQYNEEAKDLLSIFLNLYPLQLRDAYNLENIGLTEFQGRMILEDNESSAQDLIQALESSDIIDLDLTNFTNSHHLLRNLLLDKRGMPQQYFYENYYLVAIAMPDSEESNRLQQEYGWQILQAICKRNREIKIIACQNSVDPSLEWLQDNVQQGKIISLENISIIEHILAEVSQEHEKQTDR